MYYLLVLLVSKIINTQFLLTVGNDVSYMSSWRISKKDTIAKMFFDLSIVDSSGITKITQFSRLCRIITYLSKAAFRRCSVKYLFWEYSQNSQENTCARVFIKRDILSEVFPVNSAKFLRTPAMAASESLSSLSDVFFH